MARRALKALRTSSVTIAELRVVDAFSGVRLAAEPCDYPLPSHFVYHAKNDLQGRLRTDAEIDRLIQTLLAGLIDRNGQTALGAGSDSWQGTPFE